MSSNFFSASITLVLLSILPFSTAFDLVDIDGDPIENGRSYYIIPIPTTSGLTYTQKTNKECPLFITPEKTENSPGTPVLISSPLRSRFIKLDQRVSLAFKGPTLCGESLVWTQTIDPWARKLYITTGDEPSLRVPFSITKTDRSLLPMYDLKYWPSSDEDAVSSNVGLYEDDGLLGITEYPTRVSFKKAFDVLELSTS